MAEIYHSFTILRGPTHTLLTQAEFIRGRSLSPLSQAEIDYDMTATIPNFSPNQRRGCLVCAWCGGELVKSDAESALPRTSHGICQPCALKYFGLQLELPIDPSV